MSESMKAAGWLRNIPGANAKQKAMFEKVAQLLELGERRIEDLEMHNKALRDECMEQRALLNSVRAVMDPQWATEV